MLKLSYKIKKTGAYLALISYLIIVTLNAFHHHNIDLSRSDSVSNPSDQGKVLHSYLNADSVFCPVQSAYSSLQNSVISSTNSFQNYQGNIDVIHIQIDFKKPLKSISLDYSLRAPPLYS